MNLETRNEAKKDREEYTCPKCGEKVHWISGKNGKFLGHDKGSKCRCTYQSIADIKGYDETPTRGESESLGFFGKLFGKRDR